MNIPALQILVSVVFKLTSLGVGTLFAFWGFRLFSMTGRFRMKAARGSGQAADAISQENAGQVQARIGRSSLKFINAAPGAYFSVLGSVIVCFSVYSGLRIEHQLKEPQNESSESRAEVPDQPQPFAGNPNPKLGSDDTPPHGN